MFHQLALLLSSSTTSVLRRLCAASARYSCCLGLRVTCFDNVLTARILSRIPVLLFSCGVMGYRIARPSCRLPDSCVVLHLGHCVVSSCYLSAVSTSSVLTHLLLHDYAGSDVAAPVIFGRHVALRLWRSTALPFYGFAALGPASSTALPRILCITGVWRLGDGLFVCRCAAPRVVRIRASYHAVCVPHVRSLL